MKNPNYIGIVGHKKSGKTTLVERLTAEMSAKGFVIGTIKMTTHDLKFDSPGKDTHRHRIAGSKITLIKSHSEFALFTAGEYFDEHMTRAIFAPCDFVFIEGDSGSEYPKICVTDIRDIRDDIAGEIIASWGSEPKMAQVRHFDTTQIAELCDYLIVKYKRKE